MAAGESAGRSARACSHSALSDYSAQKAWATGIGLRRTGYHLSLGYPFRFPDCKGPAPMDRPLQCDFV